MKIENAQTKFFTSKEHYTAFIAAWKQFHADKLHIKYECKDYYGNVKRESDLQCVHHLIYNALRGKDVSKMFTKNTKLNNPYEAFADAKSAIKFAATSDERFARRINATPFGDTLTYDMIVMLDKELSK